MGTMTSVVVLSLPSLELQHVADALEWVFYVLFPNFCLGRVIQDIYTNSKSREACESIGKATDRAVFCKSLALANRTNPCCPENCGSSCIKLSSDYFSWNEPGIGRSLVFMSMQGVVFFLLLAVIEQGLLSRIRQALEGRRINRIEAAKSATTGRADPGQLTETPLDSDVLGERERVLNKALKDLLATESVLLRDLTKVYGSFVAVSHVSVGISSGQCFGLLGVNGAGKTTTFKMLTGDVRPTFGDAYVAGNSVIDDIRKVHQNIGYCPQFDALIDEMTVRETIWMYACLRGIPKSERKQVVDVLIDRLMLKESAVKQCGALSGGNKRRLSVAIALVGNPAIVFLDEPTTGMDPTARRLLWNTLTDVYTGGRTLILTSHSMEECEALCTRLAIMVNGEFQCIGSIQHLKTKFNEGYSLILKVKGSDVVDHEELVKRVDRVKEFVESNFPGSYLKDYHDGMLSYQVKTEGLTWSRIFGTIEEANDKLDLEDYSVSQTTLEQLFVSFARKQREEL